MSLTPRRLALGLAAAASTLAVAAAPASAGLVVGSASNCGPQPVSKPFTPWLDYADYTRMPGGDFESGAEGWELSGGAEVVEGGSGGASSLRLPAGSSATSPAICAGIEHPTSRFFVKRTSGGLGALHDLRVDVLYEDAGGTVQSQPIATVPGSSSWQPSLPLPTVVNNLALTDQTPIAFRYTPQGGSWAIDDVWVDPWRKK